MRVVGKFESLWRYRVKSMRGEELQESDVESYRRECFRRQRS